MRKAKQGGNREGLRSDVERILAKKRYTSHETSQRFLRTHAPRLQAGKLENGEPEGVMWEKMIVFVLGGGFLGASKV